MRIFTHTTLLLIAVFLTVSQKVFSQPGVGPCPYCLPEAYATPCNQPNPSNNWSNFINDFIDSFNTTGGTANITNNSSGCNTQFVTPPGTTANYFKHPCVAGKYLQCSPGQNITCNFMSGIIFSQGCAVWVDWNNDAVFSGGEMVCCTPGVPPAATWAAMNWVVPAMPNGKYRMRVRCSYATPGCFTDPCNMQSFGEAEDYTLFIGPVIGCGPTPITATATANSPLCAGQTLSLAGTYMAGGPVTYSWTGPNGFVSFAQNPVINNVQPANGGIYTFFVYDACGNATSATVNVVVNPLPNVNPSSNSPICSGGTLSLTVNSAAGYTWTGPGGFTSNQQNPVVNPAVAGNYTIKVISAQGCTAQAVTNVIVIPTPTATAGNNGPLCAGNNLVLNGSGGGTYAWTGPNGFTSGGQIPVITNAQPSASGVYSVMVTVGTCTGMATTTVVVNPAPTPTATSNSPVCLNKQITLFGLGGITYTWTGPGGFNSNLQNPVIASAQFSNAGTYTLTVSNGFGCTGTATVNIVVNPLPNITVSNPTVCLNQNINLTSTGGGTYAWSGPLGFTSAQQNPVIANAQLNMSGAYTVIVTSAQGCTAQAVANVTVLSLPQPSLTSNSPVCVGATLSFTGSGGGSYTWTGPNGFNSPLQNPSIPNVSMAANGIYSLLVTVGSCTNITTASVTINPLPTPTAVSNSPVCLLQPINFTGSGGTTYTWTGPGGYVSTQQNPVIAVAQNSNAGTYTLTVTNANGCTNSITVNVVVNPLPNIVINNPTVCLNQNINLTSTGGGTYAWSGPLGFTSAQQNPVITNAQLNMSGAYTVVVTSAQGCTAQAVANVTVIALPQPTAVSNSPVCVGATLSFTGSGGATYSWTGPNGFSSGLQNPTIPNVSMAANGVYSLVVSAGTCSNITTTTVTINPLPNPTAVSNSPVCLLKPINFTGGGGTTYTWTGPGGYISNQQNPVIAVAQNSNAGTYTLAVTNANGCTNTITTNVVVNPLPNITVNNPLVCLNQPINLTASGGTAYAWSGPLGYVSGVQNPTILNAQLNMSGPYTVVVTSAQGCTNSAVSNVTVISLPQPTAVSNSPVCVGATLSFTGSGGATYYWTGPNGFANVSQNPTIPNVSMAANGVYSLVVTAGSCSNIITTTVVVNPLPNPTAVSNSPVCLLQPINFTGGGGTTYTWTGPGGYVSNQQNPVIAIAQNSNAGTYTLTVTNANNCSNSITTNVIINPLPNITVNNPAACVGTNINLTSTGGGTYAWSGPLGYSSNQQNPVITNAQLNMNGAYTVVVTSAQGCTNSAVSNVTVISLPMPVASNNAPICVGATLSFTGSGGIGYAWSGPNGFASNQQNPFIVNAGMGANGVYTLVVSAGSCSNMATTTVVVNPLPNPMAVSNSPVCLLQPINFTGGGGTTYTWTGPGGFTSNQQNPVIAVAQNSNAGTYTLVVSNANNCVNAITTSVVINPLPVITATGAISCSNTPINLSSSGGIAYSWSGPNGFVSNQQNPIIPFAGMVNSGQYTVVGTSAFGCTASAVANVSVVPLPIANILSNDPVCLGSILAFTATGGSSYSWTGPNGFSTNAFTPLIPNAQLAAAGVYTLVATVGNCSSVTTKIVVVNPPPTPTLTSNSPVCLQQPINLIGSGGNTYSWSGPNGYSGSGNPAVILSAGNVNAGTYTAIATDVNGCVGGGTIEIIIKPLPLISAVGSTLCATRQLTLSASGGTNYVWAGPAGFTANTQSPVIDDATVNMAGTYSVTVTDLNGCFSTSLTNVVVNPIPVITLSVNTPICIGGTIHLSASATTGNSYLWTGPNIFVSQQQNPVITKAELQSTGIYTATVTDGIGCSAKAIIPVVINKLPEVTIVSDKISGCVPLCVTFSAQSSSSLVSNFWNFGDGGSVSSFSPSKCFRGPGFFNISSKFTDANGCENTAKYKVEAFPIPQADFNFAPSKPIINESVEFTDATQNTKITGWSWNFSHMKNNQVVMQPVTNLSYENPGDYAVALIVTSDKGCRDTIVKSISVGDDFGIFVPDAFTPNGDGLNDIFQPKGFGIVKYELNIFDRWGERMFTTTDFNQGWNGTFARRGDQVIEPGVYVWHIRVTTVFGKQKEVTGKVLLHN